MKYQDIRAFTSVSRTLRFCLFLNVETSFSDRVSRGRHKYAAMLYVNRDLRGVDYDKIRANSFQIDEIGIDAFTKKVNDVINHINTRNEIAVRHFRLLTRLYEKSKDEIQSHVLPLVTRHSSKTILNHIRKYLNKISPSFHKTANRYGVAPTMCLDKAASDSYVISNDKDFAIIKTPDCPILLTSRGPVDIYPKTKKHLTIPVHNLAMHKRVGELPFKIFKMGNALATNDIKTNGKPTILYALSKHVKLQANPTIYPETRQLAAIAEGVGAFGMSYYYANMLDSVSRTDMYTRQVKAGLDKTMIPFLRDQGVIDAIIDADLDD